MAKTSRLDSFRFLDLPIELRLMVYENIEPCTQHIPLSVDEDSRGALLVVHGRINPAILRTCKAIYQEAKGIIVPLAKKHDALAKMHDSIFVPKYAVQIILDAEEEESQDLVVDFLVAIGKQLKLMNGNPYQDKSAPMKSFVTVLTLSYRCPRTRLANLSTSVFPHTCVPMSIAPPATSSSLGDRFPRSASWSPNAASTMSWALHSPSQLRQTRVILWGIYACRSSAARAPWGGAPSTLVSCAIILQRWPRIQDSTHSSASSSPCMRAPPSTSFVRLAWHGVSGSKSGWYDGSCPASAMWSEEQGWLLVRIRVSI
jgi:hypothetical protein